MAKKKFGLSSTLNKNKTSEPTLPEKIPLKKSEKDIEAVKEKVDAIHGVGEGVAEKKEEAPIPKTTKAPPKPKTTKAPTTKKEAIKKPPKLVRITVDTPKEVHRKLKIKSIQADITIRDYILDLIYKDLGLK